MNHIVSLSLLLGLLVAACWIVARAPFWLRFSAVLGIVFAFTYAGFAYGIAYQRARFYSTHIYWFRTYSNHLKELADSEDDDQLSHDIQLFDRRFSKAPESAENLQDTMYEILQTGPYSKKP